ncbi:hypothetical protein [Anabaena sphaerica]|nr:hypothetical protein [Anabaena sphaerica]
MSLSSFVCDERPTGDITHWLQMKEQLASLSPVTFPLVFLESVLR